MPSSSYLASNDPDVHFGVGDTLRIDRFEVVWPDGVREQFEGSSVDRHLRLEYGSGSVVSQRTIVE